MKMYIAGAVKHTGFTLIELLVVVAIIGILAAMLFPVFSRARESARRTSCQSNLKQIGMSFAQYGGDFDERYPLNFFCDPPPASCWMKTSKLRYAAGSAVPGVWTLAAGD